MNISSGCRVKAAVFAIWCGLAMICGVGLPLRSAQAADGLKVCVDETKKTYREYDGRCTNVAVLTLQPIRNQPLKRSGAERKLTPRVPGPASVEQSAEVKPVTASSK